MEFFNNNNAVVEVDDERIGKGWTLLMSAAWFGDVAEATKLLVIGNIVRRQTQQHFSDLRRRPSIAVNSDVNARNQKNQTALMIAAKHGHLDVARLLVENGADVNAQDDDGSTASSLATANGHCSVVELLQAMGADANLHKALPQPKEN